MKKNSVLNPQKILLIRTDRIGDVILTLPMINTLAANFPGSKIDFLVNKRVSELISDYSNINKVHTIEKETVGGIKEICRENNYDLAIIVSPKYAIAMGVYLGGVKLRLGTRNRWYSFLFNIRHAQHRKDSIKHEMDYNLDLLKSINCVKEKDLKPVLKVKDEYIGSVRGKLKSKGIEERNFIVIHIPSLGSAKVWSDSNFVKLINQVAEGLDTDIVLTGTPEDLPHIQSVIAKVKNSKRVFEITDLSLKEFATLLSLCKLFVGNSTGPIHIAAAVEAFVVGLYSPVRVESPVRWGPVTDKKKIFVPDKDDDSKDVMDDIKPDEVYRFIKEYIDRK